MVQCGGVGGGSVSESMWFSVCVCVCEGGVVQ